MRSSGSSVHSATAAVRWVPSQRRSACGAGITKGHHSLDTAGHCAGWRCWRRHREAAAAVGVQRGRGRAASGPPTALGPRLLSRQPEVIGSGRPRQDRTCACEVALGERTGWVAVAASVRYGTGSCGGLCRRYRPRAFVALCAAFSLTGQNHGRVVGYEVNAASRYGHFRRGRAAGQRCGVLFCAFIKSS